MRNVMVAVAVGGLIACGACTGDDNAEPILSPADVATDEDTPVEIDLLAGAQDPEGDALTIASVAAGDHEARVVSGSTVLFTPRRDFSGRFELLVILEFGNHQVAYRTFIGGDLSCLADVHVFGVFGDDDGTAALTGDFHAAGVDQFAKRIKCKISGAGILDAFRCLYA